MWQTFLTWALSFFGSIGYLGIVILMAIESSFLPLPSELVIPPMAYLAAQGHLNIFLIIIAGVLGSVIGASINYFLSLTLGRAIIYRLINTKLAKLLLLSEAKLEKAEKMFLENASWSTFWGRLIPVVRHLISIPAGFCKMNFGKFILMTALGSFIWVSILAAFGYFLGAQQDLILKSAREISYVFLVGFIVLVAYKVLQSRKQRKNKAEQKLI